MPEMSRKFKSNPTKTNNLIYIIKNIYPPLQNPYLRPCPWNFFLSKNVELSRNAQLSLSQKNPQRKINCLNVQKHWYINYTWSDKGYRCKSDKLPYLHVDPVTWNYAYSPFKIANIPGVYLYMLYLYVLNVMYKYVNL